MKIGLPKEVARRPSQGAEVVRMRPVPVPGMLLTVALWLMVWGGYNADVARAFEPDFPVNALDLFHGLRAFLPMLAGFVAGITLLARRSVRLSPLKGPLGLLGLYALVGLISSILLSREPLVAFLWACQYASVLVVVWAALGGSHPLQHVSRLNRLNWIVVTAIALVLLAVIPLLADVVLVHVKDSLLGVRPYEGRFATEGTILGMPTTRNTGFARYDAVAALVAFASVLQGRKWCRAIWSIILVVSLFALVLSQGRTEVLSFLGGALVLLFLHRASRWLFFGTGCVGVALFAATGSFHAFWDYLMRGRQFDPTLSGRTELWRAGLDLIRESRFLGFGFHADRIFLNTNMHNALLHALVQTGLLGTIPFTAALVYGCILICRLYLIRLPQGLPALPVEIPAVIMFFAASSATESTFALYSVAWILLAPCFAYLQVLMRERQLAELRSTFAKSPSVLLGRPRLPGRTAVPREG